VTDLLAASDSRLEREERKLREMLGKLLGSTSPTGYTAAATGIPVQAGRVAAGEGTAGSRAEQQHHVMLELKTLMKSGAGREVCLGVVFRDRLATFVESKFMDRLMLIASFN
jgi:hypothetical protein